MSIIITDIGESIDINLGPGQDAMLFPKAETTVWSESADASVLCAAKWNEIR